MNLADFVKDGARLNKRLFDDLEAAITGGEFSPLEKLRRR